MYSSESEERNTESRPWADLPGDVLRIIVSLLPYQYQACFASACRSWRACVSPVYPADRCPLLAHFRKWADGLIRYYSPLSNKTFIVDSALSLPGDIALYYARDGWLLLHREYELILANPVTGAMHKSPHLDDLHMIMANGAAFSGKPPHDCTVFAINILPLFGTGVIIWKCGENSYSSTFPNNNPLEFLKNQFSAPVPLGGLFYCLGKKGNVAVYNPNEETWTVLAGPKMFDLRYKESYLVESNGELLSVIIGKYGTPIEIFKLNRVGMTWEFIENIGSTQALFVGMGMSLMTINAVKTMRNRIYFPRFRGDPEVIHAEIKCSESRIFFVPKAAAYQNSERETTVSEANIYSYCVEDGESLEYMGSKVQVYNTWYEARI